MTEARPYEAIVAAIRSGKAPEKLRAAAARGALPLPPATLAELQLLLLDDGDETVRAAAQASLDGLEGDALRQVVADEDCAPRVLTRFAKAGTRDPELAEKIVFHPHVPEAALVALALGGNGQVIELVLTNQERLLAHPVLLDRLMLNSHLRPDQRGRILDLLDRIAKSKPRSEGEGEGEPEESGDEEAAFEEAARLLDVDVGELLSASEITDGEEFEFAEDLDIRNAYKRILTLNTAQKAILAMKGGREERQILVRDTNKTVALGVLKNPRMTDMEVEGIARMRNVSDEVLRHVGNNREWSKNYPVVVALVNNPRTPPQISTNFVTRLNPRDLKNLGNNRDVPELIRRMAKRIATQRAQAQSNPLRKK